MEVPRGVEVIGGERLVLLWPDESRTELGAQLLRGACPCAACQDLQMVPEVHIRAVDIAGAYGLRITFSDGHGSGIYRYDYLHRLGSRV